MFVPFQAGGIISQFEGWDQLEELDWDAYRAKYGNIQRLDRILRAEGDDPDRYKLAKQADTVMLFYLFSRRGAPAAVRSPRRMTMAPTRCARTSLTTTAARRTARRSASSPTPECSPRLDAESSWNRFLVRCSDVDDVQGGTTKEGIHMGVMAGTLDLVQRSYMGTHVRDGVLRFDPRLPAPIRGVVLDAVPPDPAPGDAHRPPVDARRPSGGGQPADQGWGRRSSSRLPSRGPLHLRVAAGPQRSSSNSTAREEHRAETIPRGDLRRRRSARRFSAREGLARVTA